MSPIKLIMCGDHPVLAFEYDSTSGRACASGEVLDSSRLPLEFTMHGKPALYAKRIDEWWKSRAIPSTRDGIRRVLESLGAASTGELLDRTLHVGMDTCNPLAATTHGYLEFVRRVGFQK